MSLNTSRLSSDGGCDFPTGIIPKLQLLELSCPASDAAALDHADRAFARRKLLETRDFGLVNRIVFNRLCLEICANLLIVSFYLTKRWVAHYSGVADSKRPNCLLK